MFTEILISLVKLSEFVDSFQCLYHRACISRILRSCMQCSTKLMYVHIYH